MGVFEGELVTDQEGGGRRGGIGNGDYLVKGGDGLACADFACVFGGIVKILI